MITSTDTLIAIAGRMVGQAPPGYGEGLFFVFVAVIVLSIAPTVLAAIVGGVTGGLTAGASGTTGTLVGIASGIVGTMLAWGWFGLAEKFDILRGDTLLVLIFATLAIGVIAPLALVRCMRRRKLGATSWDTQP